MAAPGKPLEIAVADLAVTNLTAGATPDRENASLATLSVAVQVHNLGDDSGHNVQLVITLPPTTNVAKDDVHVTPVNKMGQTPIGRPLFDVVIVGDNKDPNVSWSVNGAVVVNVYAEVPNQSGFTVEFTGRMANRMGVMPPDRVGAFVWGSVPDNNGQNNADSVSVRKTSEAKS